MTGEHFTAELAEMSAQGLYRRLEARPSVGGRFDLNGRCILNFSSNDYLDLAGDERLKAAAVAAVAEYGCGAGASRLMSGHLEMHRRLERSLAALAGRDEALVFGSGFLTNLGVIGALVGRGGYVFADRLSHASIIDGARLSGAKLLRYRHNDPEHLETLLRRPHGTGRAIIVTDSIFSMDGDMAPLAELAELARRHECLLVVDEAHAIGVFGPRGQGACGALDPPVGADIIIGTLSKALGGYGGFVAGSSELRERLINGARSFIYSTALPPACLGAAIAATEALAERPEMGGELLARAAHFRDLLAAAGLDVGPSCSQIVPVMVGDNDRALALSRKLAAEDIIAVAIRPPTVPAGTARLRMSVTLAHRKEDLGRAADKLVAAASELGIL